MNKVILTGRLTKDGEIRTTDNGKCVYQNSIAVRRNYANKEGNYEADFFNFVYWNINNNFKKYLVKGKQVELEGRLQTRSYDDKDGNKKYVTEIIVERLGLLGDGKKEETSLEEIGVPDNYTTNYEEKEIKLSDNEIDKIFEGQQMELPF